MSEFYIDILDASDNILGDGPLNNVVSIQDTKCLDKIGTMLFETPASDPRTTYIQAGRQFDVYDWVDGYVGRFQYKSKTLSQGAAGAMLRVSCYDQMKELAQETVKFRRTYADTAVETVVAALVALATDWASDVDGGIGDTSVTYEGESILKALDVLRERWGQHYRLSDGPTLEFGAFGTASEVRLTNLKGQVQVDMEGHTELAIVESIGLVDESDEVFNKIIALGAGQGVSQITLDDATLGATVDWNGVTYQVDTITNPDGTTTSYIYDAASVTAYGARWQVATFSDIRPITNSEANRTNAGNALKWATCAYLEQHRTPLVSYDVTVRGLRQDIAVGDTVRLVYRGMVEGYAYIDVDEDFYVTDITRTRHADGDRQATLTIASTAQRLKDITSVMVDVLNSVAALKVHVPITLAYSCTGPYLRRMDSAEDAEFTVRIGDEVTALNYAKLRFRTSPLRSSVSTVPSGGSSTTVSGGGSTTVSGGGSTTVSGGGSTSGSGGGDTKTSSNGNTDHNHYIYIAAGTPDEDLGVREAGAADAIVSGVGGATYYVYTSSAGGAHTHTVTIPDHTHSTPAHQHATPDHQHATPDHQHDTPDHTHTLTYGIHEDTTYPQVISLHIDGVDRTVALGGTWAPANSSVEVEVDITDYLNDDLRKNHRIKFSCTTGQGEIEMECDMLLSIQAIAVS